MSDAKPKKYRIMVDFDGVLHQYVSPWTSLTEIHDPPVAGAIEWLEEMTKHFQVAVHSTRCESEEAIYSMMLWFLQHGLSDRARHSLEYTYTKLPALIYIDDRGLRFDGTNWPTKEFIHDSRPWNKTQVRDDEEKVQFWTDDERVGGTD